MSIIQGRSHETSDETTGDNAQFNQFVQFAEQQMQAGKATAKAQVGDAAQDNPLAGRTIVAKSGDFVGNIGRPDGEPRVFALHRSQHR